MTQRQPIPVASARPKTGPTAVFGAGTPGGTWAQNAAEMMASLGGQRLVAPSFNAWVASCMDGDGRTPRVPAAGFSVAGEAPWGGLDARACWLLDALASRYPRAHWLFFVQSPAEAAVSALLDALNHEQPQTDWIESAVRQWIDGADLILRHLGRRHAASLVIGVSEWRDHPEETWLRLANWLQVPHGELPTSLAPRATCPEMLALAHAHPATRGRAFRLYQQLLAFSTPWSGDEPSLPQPGLSTLELADAARQWRDAKQRSAQFDAACLQVSSLGAKLEARTGDAQEALERASVLEAELQARTGEAQEALERASVLEAELQARTGELEACQCRAEQLDQGLAQARAEMKQGESRVCSLQEQLQALRAEDSYLLRNLHEAQEALEANALRTADVCASPLNHSWAACAAHIAIGSTSVGAQVSEGQHLELRFSLSEVRARDRSLSVVDLKLVEHLGRPGLALLRAPEGSTPLLAWRPDGAEPGAGTGDDREFVLMVPADHEGQARLARLGTGDFLFVKALVAHLCQVLDQEPQAPSSLWPDVARRLLESLQRLPERWRYDRVDVVQLDNERCNVQFANVACGPFLSSSVSIEWRPQDGDTSEILVHAPASSEDAYLIEDWPRSVSGDLAASWTIPVTAPGRWAERKAKWMRLSARDRDLVVKMLDALPAAAEVEPALPSVPEGVLRRAAGSALRLALRAQHRGRVRRILRALRGRMD